LLFWHCAQVVPLNGGVHDDQAPKLIESNPVNASLNFKSKTIEFRFDEFVQVKDIANQLVITPQTKEMPYVEASGKRITVKFNEDLLPNTTYRLFFGNSISDMHEGNTFSNFEFVFSTGNTIDSLFMKGKTINAFNLRSEKAVTVGLYAEDEPDSVIYKKKPLYFSKALDDGSYKLSYLPKASFRLFAFTDINKNLMYDGGEEAVGFNSTKIETGADTTINVNVFKEETAKVFLKKAYSPFYGVALAIYNKEQDNVVKAYYKDQSANIKAIKEVNDSCKIFYNDIYDTLRVLIHHAERNTTDSLSISVSSKERFERLKTEKKLYLNIELDPVQGNRLDYYAKPVLVFNNWMDESATDTSKMIFRYKTDSLIKTGLILKQQGPDMFNIGNTLLPNTNYELILNKGAFKTKAGIESDSVKISFKTTETSDYGILNTKLLLPKKENYIVQVLNDKDAVVAEQYIEMSLTTSAEQLLKFKNLLPGNYFLKVIEDKNQNKKWDTGNVLHQKQPETIYFNALAIKLLADWDSETVWKVE
jgi:hypothetical protein